MKTSLALATAVATLSLIGAGCAKSEPADQPQVQTKSATEETKTDEQSAVVNKSGCADGLDLCLTGEAQGEGKVKLVWQVGDDTAKSAEAYRIVMNKDENPDWMHKSFWFERNKTARDKVLEGMPLGEKHFRVCTVVKGECAGYSNDVMVEIK